MDSEPAKATYHIGQRFCNEKMDERAYILCQSRSFECCLINLFTGNRKLSPKLVVDPHAITQDELDSMSGNAMQLLGILKGETDDNR